MVLYTVINAKPLTAGKLLTAEQSKRLGMMERAGREAAVELIVAHLRFASRASHGHTEKISTPRDWYTRAAEDWV